jgi:predicted MPP superfamily phosphohydrolase
MGLVVFVSVFLSLYGGMHFYVLLKIKKAFSLGFPAEAAIICLMVLMVVSPILVRVLESHGFEDTGRVMAYVGYGWMGLLFLFLVLSLAGDLVRALLPSGLKPSPLLTFIIAACFSFMLSLYGLYEAMDIRTEQVTVVSPKLGGDRPSLRIVQISDVHLGLLFREHRLRKVVERIKDASPDMLVSTGDLVDGQTDGLSGVLDLLRELNPPLGKYAVTGNHEFYAGIRKSLDFTREAGFKVLRDEAVALPGLINIAGVDDPAGGRRNPEKHEKEILSSLPGEIFTLLLKHRPQVEAESEGLFDLQLSGHTHKGQIFPFGLLVRLAHGRISGLYKLPSGSSLYISRGSGTWGPPLRILSPPEVTVINVMAGNPPGDLPSRSSSN